MGLLLGEGVAPAFADDDSPPANQWHRSFITLIDNSDADSWLEVDRTLNSEIGAGTAGSDHDGGEVRTDQTAAAPAAQESTSPAPAPESGSE